MADVAELGFAVDSRPIAEAKKELGELSSEATKAGSAAEKFGGTATKAGSATAKLGSSAERSAMVMGKLKASFVGFATSAIAQLAAMATAAASITAAITSARSFAAAMAEVSTLMDESTGSLDALGMAARRMSREFGGTAAQQVEGFYQAISAGAQDVVQAERILEAANRTAIGGVTDVRTAVDVLTTAVNAYARQGLTAADAADALFVGMRAGKTTIDELASAIGRVVPIASSMGVGFDELVASVSALTTQGISTAEAVTGVRAILASIAKPSADAAKAAAELGLNFSVAGLEAKGFQRFLEEAIQATGGSADVMARLFGQIEALTPALSLAGGGGEQFARIMDLMAERAGVAEKAYELVAKSLSGRLNVVMGKFGDMALSAGMTLLRIMVPALEAIANWLPTIARLLTAVGAGMAVAFGPAIIGMVATLAKAIGITLVASIRALTLAIAANPIGALAVAITTVTVAIYQFRDALGDLLGIDLEGFFRGISGGFLGTSAEAAELEAETARLEAQLASLDGTIADMLGGTSPIADGLTAPLVEARNVFAELRNDMARGIQVEQANFLEAMGRPEDAAALRHEIEQIDLIARGQGELSGQQIDYLLQQLDIQRQIRAETEAALAVEQVREELSQVFTSDLGRRTAQYQQQMEILREALEAELLTRDEFRELEMQAIVAFDEWKLERQAAMEAEQIDAMRRLKESEEQLLQQRLQGWSGFFGNLATIAAAGGKKTFAIFKAFAIAQATIDAIAAAQGAYKVGAGIGGPPLGAAFAAAAFGAQMARIAQIRATDYTGTASSNAGSRGGSGGTAAAPQQPAAPRAQDVTIRLDSDRALFSRGEIEQILEGLNEALADGAQIRVAR